MFAGAYHLMCWLAGCLAASSDFPVPLIPSLNLFIVPFVLPLALFLQTGDGSHSGGTLQLYYVPSSSQEAEAVALKDIDFIFVLLWIRAIFPAVSSVC